MTATLNRYPFTSITYTVAIGGLVANTGETTVDSSGDSLVIPNGFVVAFGNLVADDADANNTLDIGVDGGTEDLFIDGQSIASGPVYVATRVQAMNYRAGANSVLIVKNVGSANIPASKTATITLYGQQRFDTVE